ncbi:hypothetical protein DM860_013813 [Cuscuta australis]|uniref:Endonuclease/exonuclease/phosphatase domain-containing protein n=1 Tax=Cuscuta australis TaxID=267555 RepID=A0A328DI42_9ASTE|nr:hypothetical protein DM860_013813 [Cuscuta australis]
MDNSPILISAIYGAHTVMARKELWNQLCSLCPSNNRWIVGGDFNAITSPHESKGTCGPNPSSMEDFNSCILHCKLINLDPQGSIYTWSGVRSQGRTWRRLDRVLINLELLALFQDVELHHLAKSNSDHKPILLHCNDQTPNTIKPFRFLNTWTLHEDFLNTVKQAWTTCPTIGDDLMIFTKGDILNLLKLNNILKVYMQASGQQINLSKSRFYTPKSTSTDQQARMARALSMNCGSLPFTYLGATLRRGILKKEDCNGLLSHV